MASTPPSVPGSPQEESWRRWAEERLQSLGSETAAQDTRVRAVTQSASNVGGVASSATITAGKAIERTKGNDSLNRVARPLTDVEFWQDVTAGRTYVWEYDIELAGERYTDRSISRNVTAGTGALSFFASDDEGASIDITPISPMPASRRIYIKAGYSPSPSLAPDAEVFLWSAAGVPLTGDDLSPFDLTQPIVVPGGSGSVELPPGLDASSLGYSVRLTRPPGSGIGGVISPVTVFEAIGDGNGFITTPDGIVVEGPDGEKVVEISPTAPVLDAPTPPILDSSMGSVSLEWDGKLTGGITPPATFSYLRAETSATSSGPWTATGQVLNKAGSIMVSGAPGTSPFYRFVAVDTINRPSPPSTSVTTSVQGIRIPDLSADVSGAIQDAIDTADNAWDAASVAVTDTLIEYASNSSETVAPTSGWSVTPPTRTAGSFIWQRTKITYGSGSTTTTSAVLLTGNTGGAGAPGNPGAPGQPGAPGDPGTDGVSVTSVQVYYRTTPEGGAAPAVPTTSTPPAPWTATEPDYAPGVDLWAVTRVGFSDSTFSYTPVSKVSAYTAAQAAMTTADGKNRVLVSATTPPASSLVTAGDQWLQLDATGTSIIAIKTWDGTGWNERPLWASSVIAAESITAPLIKAGEIEVNHVSPSFGDTLDLQGNGAINLIAGQVDANVESLNDQQLVLDTHDTQITAAQQAAEDASGEASSANVAAAAAQAAAAAAQGDVDKLALALTLTPEDLRLSRPGDPVALHMANGNISIRRNGTAQTWWDEQQMVVPKLKATQVIVGSTVITEGSGRTTWQRL